MVRQMRLSLPVSVILLCYLTVAVACFSIPFHVVIPVSPVIEEFVDFCEDAQELNRWEGKPTDVSLSGFLGVAVLSFPSQGFPIISDLQRSLPTHFDRQHAPMIHPQRLVAGGSPLLFLLLWLPFEVQRRQSEHTEDGCHVIYAP
jgi:hypothetical protein